MKMYRWFILVLAMVPLLLGAETEKPGCQDIATEMLIASTAIEIGCSVKESGKTGLDGAFRDVYEFAKTGEIPQSAIDRLNKELAQAFDDRPTLGLQIANLSRIANVDIPDAGIGGAFGKVSPELLSAMASGYDSGYKVCDGPNGGS